MQSKVREESRRKRAEEKANKEKSPLKINESDVLSYDVISEGPLLSVSASVPASVFVDIIKEKRRKRAEEKANKKRNKGENDTASTDFVSAQSKTLNIPTNFPPSIVESNDSNFKVNNSSSNKQFKTNYSLKNLTDNMEHLTGLINKVETTDSRRNGVGSSGGHIARELKARGPLNGHRPVSRGQVSPLNHHQYILPKIRPEPKELSLPEWNGRFVLERCLTPKVETTSGKVSRSSVFREEILKFRDISSTRRLMSSTAPASNVDAKIRYSPMNFENRVGSPTTATTRRGSRSSYDSKPKSSPQQNKNKSQLSSPLKKGHALIKRVSTAGSRRSKSPAAGTLKRLKKSKSPKKTDKKKVDVVYVFDQHQQKQQHQQQQQQYLSPFLIQMAMHVWDKLLLELRDSGIKIKYRDLIELAALREPTENVVMLMGYISVLLGLKPTWQAARASLFKELSPMQMYLKEVEPLTIPLRRLKKAAMLKEENLSSISIESFRSVCKPLMKIARWVIAFNQIALLILTVDENKKNKNYENLNIYDAEQANNATTLQQQQQQEEQKNTFFSQQSLSPPCTADSTVDIKKLLEQNYNDKSSILKQFFNDFASDEKTLEYWLSIVDHKKSSGIYAHNEEEKSVGSRIITRGSFNCNESETSSLINDEDDDKKNYIVANASNISKIIKNNFNTESKQNNSSVPLPLKKENNSFMNNAEPATIANKKTQLINNVDNTKIYNVENTKVPNTAINNEDGNEGKNSTNKKTFGGIASLDSLWNGDLNSIHSEYDRVGDNKDLMSRVSDDASILTDNFDEILVKSTTIVEPIVALYEQVSTVKGKNSDVVDVSYQLFNQQKTSNIFEDSKDFQGSNESNNAMVEYTNLGNTLSSVEIDTQKMILNKEGFPSDVKNSVYPSNSLDSVYLQQQEKNSINIVDNNKEQFEDDFVDLDDDPVVYYCDGKMIDSKVLESADSMLDDEIIENDLLVHTMKGVEEKQVYDNKELNDNNTMKKSTSIVCIHHEDSVMFVEVPTSNDETETKEMEQDLKTTTVNAVKLELEEKN